jgi:preprotein translocase subunit SecG
MSFLIGLLTVVLVLNCLVLIFLVLIQLPKKDAGAGLAFGGGATDALFGAGSGNVLTKITKWSAGIFFGLAIVLSLMSISYNKHQHKLEVTYPTAPTTLPQPVTPAPAAPVTPAAVPAATNGLLNIPVPATVATNAPAAK